MSITSFIKRKFLGRVQQKIKEKKEEKKFLSDYNTFLQAGETPHETYMSFINLYCSTNGRLNENVHQKIKETNPPVKVADKLEGIAGTFTTSDFKNINNELEEKGYVKFEKKLSQDIIDKIYNYALQTGAKIPPDYNTKIVYDPSNPVSEIYRFDIQDLINNPEIQTLIMDPVLINVARNYLQCEPIFDFPALWWSTSFSKEASSEAAQLYHFDMDRIKWLKIFFYITDVSENNGPHCYIEGSHKPGNKPDSLLKRGYARISDEDLKPYYKSESFKVLCADAGTIFAGDTKCWHKGSPLLNGHRLAFELEYTSSLFGANIPKMQVKNASPMFRDFCMNNKIYASNIELI
ncbi:MAG: phytanoyl-CoA dioxygenase family protein [Chitinophagaceae bacterium]